MVTSDTTATKTHQAYQLDESSSHREGYGETELPEYDAWLITESIDCTTIKYSFWKPNSLQLPERIEFESVGNFLMIHDLMRTRVTDFPYNRQGWPIMSKRMLETLLSVREFPHQVIPIVMLDAFTPAEFEENHDYVAVQLLEHQDVFDWEKSIYELDPEVPNCIKSTSLEKIVLRTPPEGFPPLFRIGTASLRPDLYVSPEGKAALESAGIRGVNFVPLRGSWLP
jgi:hypothetical protein